MISRKVAAWRDWTSIRPVWDALCQRSTHDCFFLSADWVETWLEVYGEALQPQFLLFESQGVTVGACFLVRANVWRKVVPFRCLFLNSACEELDDHTAIEYNTFLSLPGHEDAVAASLSERLAGQAWDELRIEGAIPSAASPVQSLGVVERSGKAAQYVDLQQLREQGGSYDDALSSNTRQQIRRSLKLYEQSGAVEFTASASVEQALADLRVLAELHQAAWTDRGKPGAFATRNFVEFHERLIRKTFAKGRVRVLLLRVAGTPVAGLYNFHYNGRVYFYQSGFAYSEDNRLKPGMVAHYLAIQQCLADPDLREYDFLAGEQRYKKSLSTHERPLEWISVLRSTPRVRFFQFLRRLKR